MIAEAANGVDMDDERDEASGDRADSPTVRDDRTRKLVEREQEDDVRRKKQSVKAVVDGVGRVGGEREEGSQGSEIQRIGADVNEKYGRDDCPRQGAAHAQEGAREGLREGRFQHQKGGYRNP